MSELERALVALGRELDVPEAPDVAAAVRARLERRGDGAPRLRLPRRRWVPAVALAALVALAATLAVPEARSALFRVLHIGGERIEFVGELPEVTPEPSELDLEAVLGPRVSLVEARRRAGFGLRELEEVPDRVYMGSRGTVWFLYGRPDSVRLLMAQTALLSVDEQLILKKLAGPGTVVDEVSVAGERGYFLGGEPHVVLLLDENGEPVEEGTWLARNVLVWQDGEIALRLEGDFTKDEALELAESLR